MKYTHFFTAVILLSLAITQPALAEDDTQQPRYIVQSGDSLGVIALQFGVSVDELLAANSLANPNTIAAGDELIIPGLEGISGILINQSNPVGQTLRVIEIEKQIPVEKLIKLNHLTSPAEFYAGANVIVPQQENSPIQFAARLKNNQSDLDFAIQHNSNPATLQIINQTAGDWGRIPGDALFIVATDKETDNNPAAPATLNESDLSIVPMPVVQGQTGMVKIATADASKIHGEIADHELHFMQMNEQTAVAFFGVSAMQDTGLVEFSIQSSPDSDDPLALSQMLVVSSGNYNKDAPLVVDPVMLDPKVTEPEDQVLQEITSIITPVKYWNGVFQYPVDDPCVNAFFGNRRSYNGSAFTYFHTGVDFGVCANNLNVYADAPGVVVFTGAQEIRGNSIIVDHGWGVFSGFWHLSQINVATGDQVQPGQLIGQIGNTGRSTGPHLHWEMLVNGVQVNPFTWVENAYP